jgi:hypothetical protein
MICVGNGEAAKLLCRAEYSAAIDKAAREYSSFWFEFEGPSRAVLVGEEMPWKFVGLPICGDPWSSSFSIEFSNAILLRFSVD